MDMLASISGSCIAGATRDADLQASEIGVVFFAVPL
jgi:uncharacterized membrane protein